MLFLPSRFITFLLVSQFSLTGPVLAQMLQMEGAEYPYPEEITELPPITEPMSWWLILLLVAGGLGVLCILTALLLREAPPKGVLKIPPLRIAFEELQKLRSRLDAFTPSEAAHQVSLILRSYQLDRYAVPAPYRTSEELYQEGRLQTRKELQERFTPLSVIHDRIAFAAQPSNRSEVEDLIDASIEALKTENDGSFAALMKEPK